jgi:ABC-2 type transport system permease protein
VIRQTIRQTAVLAKRGIRESLRTPEALLPMVFIPVFFLVVNLGQVARVFTKNDTPFLHGQSYAAFQLPNSLLLSASFGAAAMYLVTDIEKGYFDKLRATPTARSALVLGRLIAEGVKCVVVTLALIVVALFFGVHIASGLTGWLLLVVMSTIWAVIFSGFMQLVAMKSRNAAATQSASMVFFPLLFLTPNVVPRDVLARPMEIAATFNPVTYLMEGQRTLILGNVAWGKVGIGFVVLGVLLALMLFLNIRTVNNYD